MPKTLEKPAAEPSDPLVERVVQTQIDQFQAAEKLLLQHAREGKQLHDFSGGELLLFQSMQWSMHDVRAQLGRCARVIQLLADSSTAAERGAARDRLAKAQERDATEGQSLRDELVKVTSELREKIDAIESKAAAAQRVCDGHAQAIELLRGCVPKHVKKAADLAKDRARHQHVERVLDLRNAIARAEKFPTINGTSLAGSREAAELAKTWAPHCLRADDRATIHAPTWQAFAAGLAAELPRLRKELSAALEEQQRDVAAAESVALDIYAV